MISAEDPAPGRLAPPGSTDRETRDRYFRQFADHVASLSWMEDDRGEVTFASERWSAIVGGGGPARTATIFERAVHRDDLERALGAVERAAATGGGYECELRLRDDGGAYRWYLLRTTPILAADGRLESRFGTAVDIDARKSADIALRERDGFLERLLETTEDCIKVLDLAGNVVSMNAGGVRALEFEADDQWHGVDWRTFWNGREREAADAAIAVALGGGIGRFLGFTTLRRSKTPTWWDVVVSPIRDERGLPVRLLATSRNVTEIRSISTALSETERSYRMLADTLPAIVWSASADGSVDFVNERWTQYTGNSFEDSMGASWSPLIHPDDRERSQASWDAARDAQEPLEAEYRLRRASDGSYRWHVTRAVPLLDEDGAAIRWFGTVTDIEERKTSYDRAREWSNSFQQASLPPSLPSVIGLQFDAVYEPGLSDSQVGGDWYDALQLADGRVVVAIGDVTGSGMQAAVVMSVVRQIMRGIAQVHADPALMLDAADRALRAEHPDVFVTAWVGVLDLVTRSLSYASAGHPPPLLVTRDGRVAELQHRALPLGLRKGHDVAATVVDVEDGSTLVLFTDGLTEATRDIAEGMRLLEQAATTIATGLSEHPARDIATAVLPNGADDDVAILTVCMDFAAIGSHLDRWTIDLRDAGRATAARRDFRAAMVARGVVPDALPNAELIFGELIGNVVRHAPGEVEMIVDYRGDQPVLHALDNGPGFRHVSRLPFDKFSESGRGLYIVSCVADDFTVNARPAGGSHARVVIDAAHRAAKDRRQGSAAALRNREA